VKILALVNYYLPGYKGGGPIQSVANMAAMLGDDFQFKVITTDRDHRDAQSYAGVKAGEWQQVGRTSVLYLASRDLSLRNLRHVLNSTEYDILYLNSLFHPEFTIRPLLLWWTRMVRRTPVIVAPRGEFSPGALTIKPLKKQLYLSAVKVCGLYDKVLWHASSSYEENDIRRWFGSGAVVDQAPIIVAPDLVPKSLFSEQTSQRRKTRGSLRLIFVSRISPKKNLDGALRCLKGLRGSVEFDIYGPVDSDAYWAECQQIIRDLPYNISVTYHGTLRHEEVLQEFVRHDLLFLPTLGENFGHVILESLRAGCPVLISDRTPWRNLEAEGVGWDIPVEDTSAFQKVLQHCLEMDNQELRKMCERARDLAETVAHDDSSLWRNRELFLKASERVQC
jgi:glycosyltransferase involved in cell wall biosynthesis